MTRAEEDDWIRVLAEGGSEFPLAFLASSELLRFTLALATEVYGMRSSLASLPGESRTHWESLCPTYWTRITSSTWLPCTHTESGWTPRVPDDHETPNPLTAERPEWDGDDIAYVDRIRRLSDGVPTDD